MVRPEFIDWDDEDDPAGNVRHIADHDVSPDEVEEILDDPRSRDGTSRSSGLPTRYGWTSAGRFIVVVYSILKDDPLIIRPVTAFEPDDAGPPL